MKVYIVEEYLNDYPENGGGYQGIAAVFTDKSKQLNFVSRRAFLKITNLQKVKPIMNM